MVVYVDSFRRVNAQRPLQARPLGRGAPQAQQAQNPNPKAAPSAAPPKKVGRSPTARHAALQQTGDVEVTQTIVLPSKQKAERLNFTEKWLSDDIKGWTGQKADCAPGAKAERSDSEEEHSLGSCSAEVAAINAPEPVRGRRRRPNGQAEAQPAAPAQNVTTAQK